MIPNNELSIPTLPDAAPSPSPALKSESRLRSRCDDAPSTPAPSLKDLSDQDRDRLTLLFRTRGDAVSFAALREEDPLEMLVWLTQPHIQPWHEAIKAAHRDHEQTETHLSLARALKDITRILDLEADSKLRIRAVNAIIRLANAMHRANRATDRATDFASTVPESPRSSVAKSVRTTRGAVEPHRATDFASSCPESPSPSAAKSVRTTSGAVELRRATDFAREDPPAHANGTHHNAALITGAATPRPPPRRPRKRRR